MCLNGLDWLCSNLEKKCDGRNPWIKKKKFWVLKSIVPKKIRERENKRKCQRKEERKKDDDWKEKVWWKKLYYKFKTFRNSEKIMICVICECAYTLYALVLMN